MGGRYLETIYEYGLLGVVFFPIKSWSKCVTLANIKCSEGGPFVVTSRLIVGM